MASPVERRARRCQHGARRAADHRADWPADDSAADSADRRPLGLSSRGAARQRQRASCGDQNLMHCAGFPKVSLKGQRRA
jgi:hypothetical protein